MREKIEVSGLQGFKTDGFCSDEGDGGGDQEVGRIGMEKLADESHSSGQCEEASPALAAGINIAHSLNSKHCSVEHQLSSMQV